MLQFSCIIREDCFFKLWRKNAESFHTNATTRVDAWNCVKQHEQTLKINTIITHFNPLKRRGEPVVCLYTECEYPRSTSSVNLNRQCRLWSSAEISSICCITANDLITQACGRFKMEQCVIYLGVMHFKLNKHTLIK